MGTFLTTSILTKFSIEKSTLDLIEGNSKYKLIQKEFIGTDIDLFGISESDGVIVFEVKENIIQDELIPFLKIFYKDFHGEEDTECNLIIDSLEEKTEVREWLQIAENVEYQNFQMNCYGLAIIDQGRNEVSINYNSITLAMEGKIMMESYGQHFSFFESLIKKCYSDFKLSNLILVNISG